MGPAELAELLQLNAIRIAFLVLGAAIVPVLALSAFQCDTDAHSRHLQTVEIPLEFNTFQIGCQYLSRLRFCPVLLHFQEKRGKNPPETANVVQKEDWTSWAPTRESW
jgi:hypothetical protein